MTYADKGLSLYVLMNDMSDTLILESDIRGRAVVKPKRERAGRFSAFMNHPAMVAALCAVVSLGVVVAIVMAGRGGPVMPPVVGTPPAETETREPPDSEPETRYEPTEQVSDYILIPHTPTAGINDNYFRISMTATEPGKALTASASYQLYRLNGDEEELIHNYDVELAVYEEPAGPEDYAVYETGVSLVWAKSNLEAKGDTLTPGWYRVKFGRATLDFELVDKTGQAPAVHPFAELSVPTMVYTSMSTEDMALYEQYERIYTSKDKIEKLWAFFTKLTVTEANPPENIRSGDGLGIHVTYPDGTKGRIFFWGEQHEYFYIDDGPWYQAPPEEVAALMTQIKNVMSDPT